MKKGSSGNNAQAHDEIRRLKGKIEALGKEIKRQQGEIAELKTLTNRQSAYGRGVKIGFDGVTELAAAMYDRRQSEWECVMENEPETDLAKLLKMHGWLRKRKEAA